MEEYGGKGVARAEGGNNGVKAVPAPANSQMRGEPAHDARGEDVGQPARALTWAGDEAIGTGKSDGWRPPQISALLSVSELAGDRY